MKDYNLESISAGVAYLQDGYIDYAKEVIAGRALPDKYDGLKPVNRRSLFTLHKDKVTKNMKSERASGNVLALHPHGSGSVYQAMVLMTDKNGSWAVPVFAGTGNWGGVYKEDTAAAPRYTEIKLHRNAELYFQEMNGITMIPNFDSTEMEPLQLPVQFPAVLVNSTSGIAVVFSSNIPSFNFNDVCDLVIEYIKDGSCHTIIAPDFVTGGYYVRDDKELTKLMRVGTAKLKLRGRTIVDGKKIVCTEVPYGKTIQGLLRQINALDSSNIRTAYDTDDFDESSITIDCSSKSKVDAVLFQLLKDTDLQYSYSASITVVDDGIPVTQGVWKVIEDWVAWRKQVLTSEFNYQIQAYKQSAREAVAFMNVVNDYEKRMKLTEIVASSGSAAGAKFITENFSREDVPADLIDFVSSRSLPSYHSGGKYASAYASCMARVKEFEGYLADLDAYIVRQMESLKANYGSAFARQTEVTTKDYAFTESEETKERAIDNSVCTFVVKNGFVRKLKGYSGSDEDFRIDGYASDTLVLFDNRGRIIRVYGEELPYTGTELGIYVPSYGNFDETDDYRITYACRLEDKELMLFYSDGNVGFVNMAEWLGNTRSVKVLQQGISTACADKLAFVMPFEEVPELYFATDDSGRVGWCYIHELKHKHRTAKTRAIELAANSSIVAVNLSPLAEGSLLLGNMAYYKDKMRFLADETDYHGNEDTFVAIV